MDWKLVYSVLKDIVLLIAVIYTWWANRDKVRTQRLTDLETKIGDRVTKQALDAIEVARLRRCDSHLERTDAIEGRLDHFEGEFKHLPGRKEIGELYKRLDGLNGSLERLAGRVEETNHQGRLVLETLLREGK